MESCFRAFGDFWVASWVEPDPREVLAADAAGAAAGRQTRFCSVPGYHGVSQDRFCTSSGWYVANLSMPLNRDGRIDPAARRQSRDVAGWGELGHAAACRDLALLWRELQAGEWNGGFVDGEGCF